VFGQEKGEKRELEMVKEREVRKWDVTTKRAMKGFSGVNKTPIPRSSSP
jgi:hypothetical protein